MHQIAVQCRFTFGDVVRFDSPSQGCSGTGKIVGVNIYDDWTYSYTVEIGQDGYEVYQPGIAEKEISGMADT